jgi:hypothetical protein
MKKYIVLVVLFSGFSFNTWSFNPFSKGDWGSLGSTIVDIAEKGGSGVISVANTIDRDKDAYNRTNMNITEESRKKIINMFSYVPPQDPRRDRGVAGVNKAVSETVDGVNTAVDKVAGAAGMAAIMLHIIDPKSPDPKKKIIDTLNADIAAVKKAQTAYLKLFNDHGKGTLNDVGAFLVGKGIHNSLGSDLQEPYIQHAMQGNYSSYFVNALVEVLPKLAGIYDALTTDWDLWPSSIWEVLKCPSGPKCASILDIIPKVGNTIADKMVAAFEAQIKKTQSQP